MTQWEARLAMIIRGDVDGSVCPRTEISTSTGSDEREQSIVWKARTVHAADRTSPQQDDAFQLRLAQRASDGAQNRAVHASDELVVEAQRDGDTTIVALRGEIDLATADRVREALTRAISESPRRLTVDLSHVTFIDSSGLHVILDTYTLCRESGATLTIRPGPPSVQQVFELTNLLEYLPFEISG